MNDLANIISPKDAQQLIAQLIRPKNNPLGDEEWDSIPEINIVEQVILGTFRPCTSKNGNTCYCPLSKEVIYRRLAVIDSLFSTNAGMGYFILQDMTEAIWEECLDANGYHTDAELVRKAEDYIRQCLNNANVSQHPIKQKLLDSKFGYNASTLNPQQEYSLLTKYLHYLLEAADSQIGFPIIDRLVPALTHKFINQSPANPMNTSFPQYVRALDSIGNTWQVQGYAGWSCFHVLDRLLWTIAKINQAANKTTKPITCNMKRIHILLSKKEFHSVVIDKNTLMPQHPILYIQQHIIPQLPK